ncbi:MAG: two-component regulator propeller domain-containing protein [Ferruginibacter sp.]
MKKHFHITSIISLLAILLFLSIKIDAQSYFFRHYQVENGLSNNTVFCSIQDKNGFMWFGTKDGLNRFDGYHFKHFNINDDGHNMTPDIISCMLTNEDGTLFIGCQKGLFTFDRENEKIVPLIDSLPWINNMVIDQSGQLWFISEQTVYRFNLKTKALRAFFTEQYFTATTLCMVGNDLWIGTTDGFLNRYNPAKENFTAYDVFKHSPFAASHWIQNIHPGGNNAVLVGTSSQGIKKFNIPTLTYKDLLIYNPDNTTIYVRDIQQYNENEYWFATESGIFIMDYTTEKFINLKKKFLDPYSLSDNAVYALCKDKEGGIWAGTFFGGVNYYSKEYATFKKYYPDNSKYSISGSAVREICGDHSGNVWIGTEDAGLNKLNLATGDITQYLPSGESSNIAYSNIHGLLVVGNDLWIGTFDHGLDIMDIQTGKVKIHYGAGPGIKDLKSNFVVSMLQTKSGDIYAGTGNSLFKFDKKSNGFDLVSEVPPNIFVACLLEGADNTIWVGSHGSGIFYFNPVTKAKGQFKNERTNDNSLTNDIINAIYEDSKKNLWFSTEGGGLCKLSVDRKRLTAFTTKNGLPSNFIFKALEDDKRNLWITTSRGLVNFNPENLSVTVYTKDNGLLNDQFNYNSGYKDDQGKMYFGSVKGMITFKPDDFSKTAIMPPVFITGFQVQNEELGVSRDSSPLKKSILYTDQLTLPYDRSSFSLDFAALSFISPDMTGYKYIMEGLDKDWTLIKPNRKIYFTNLSPGKYTFKLKSSINGAWSKDEKQLVIRILPPIWATTWAYILYIVITIALAYYLLRSYHIIIEDKKEKEIYEAKIDFFTNVAHEIRTPLTLIKGPIENLREKLDEVPEIREDVLMMERNTNRLIALITQILDFRQTEAKGFSIDFAKINITELLREAHLNFAALAKKRNLQYCIETPGNDLYAFADEEALTKIFSNLLSNAIKYAQHKVNIKLLSPEVNGASFSLEIENDGAVVPDELREKIFEPFFRLKDSLKQQGTGIGLALAKSLTELHQGDLFLDTNGGQNKFILVLPLNPADKITNKQRLLKIKL